MIYLLYGNDHMRSRKKLHELLLLAKKKRPDAEIFRINSENWSEVQFEELLVSQGLFEQKYTVVLDNLFERKDAKAYFIERLAAVGDSDQIFLMLESGIDASSLKKIEKHAKQVQEFAKTETKKSFFNIFSVADGLLEKDKKKLWISYIDAVKRGSAPEEVHGIFFWQIKNMLIASKAKSATDSGISPYAFKNALSGSRKYRTEELVKMSGDLVNMTHRVRTGEGDMDVMLEKWVLSV